VVLGIEEPTPVLEQTNGDPRRGARALRSISASPSAEGARTRLGSGDPELSSRTEPLRGGMCVS
jgi:hypothetical protein